MNSVRNVVLPREALVELCDQYLDALRRKEPGKLDLSSLRKFTENGQTLPVGQGLWRSVDSVAEEPFAMVIDESAGTLVALTGVHEAGLPSVLSTRIATAEGKITELETVVSRGTSSPRSNSTMVPAGFERRAVLDEQIPIESRASRQELALPATLYLESIERGDGSVVPVADECVRFENGLKMTLNPTGEGFPADELGAKRYGSSMTRLDVLAMTVADQMAASVISNVVERIRDRRFAAIDETRGTVAIFFIFDHCQNVSDTRALATIAHPNCCYAAELFKVVDGKITHIEAGFELVPYGAESGWQR